MVLRPTCEQKLDAGSPCVDGSRDVLDQLLSVIISALVDCIKYAGLLIGGGGGAFEKRLQRLAKDSDWFAPRAPNLSRKAGVRDFWILDKQLVEDGTKTVSRAFLIVEIVLEE